MTVLQCDEWSAWWFTHQRRAALGIPVMQHGKDYLCATPGFTTFDQLEEARLVQQETGRMYTVFFGESLANRATVKAGELVQAGRIYVG